MDFDTIPEGLEVEPNDDGVLIRRKWFGWSFLILLFFTFFWDGLMVEIIMKGMNSPHANNHFPLFIIPHVLVGLFLPYYAAANLLNRTDITISAAGVRVATGPVPWPGNKTIAASDIADVFTRLRRGSRGSVSYALVYAGEDRQEKTLVSFYREMEQAEFVAFKIRQRLGLKTRAASGPA